MTSSTANAARPSLWRRAEQVRKSGMRSENLLWTRWISYRIGAFVTLALLPTRLTPNHVTLLGLALSAVGAGVVTATASHVDPPLVVVVLLTWQLAFGLDCADGLLARTRATSSAFGAWLDQLADFVGHILITGSLTFAVVLNLSVDSTSAVLLTATITGASTLQIFATSQRDVSFGAQPKGASVRGRMRLFLPAIHLVDYGLFLFVSAVLLLVPVWLLVYLIVSSVLSLGFLVAQLLVFGRAQSNG